MVRLKAISHVAYYAPHLGEMCRFLTDFGLIQVGEGDDEAALYMRGIGSSPFIHKTLKADQIGLAYIAFEAQDREDVFEAARLSGTSSPQQMDGPAAGIFATLKDPDGIEIRIVHWDVLAEEMPSQVLPALNTPSEKYRKGQTVRPLAGPCPVYRLGHVLLHVRDMSKTDDWYRSTFGLRLSDGLYQEQPENFVGGFYRLSRGDDYVDHHSIGFIVGTPDLAGTAHHSSFEVHSFDDVGMGHQWLAKRGWRSRWGIGRHVLGSQVFDYWYDPFGNVIEHYADGDVFNEDTEPGFHANSVDILSSWAPDRPL
jgi:catechol 2,3-dioxygenase-like lactoylglutathione lyase family enzyme